jgi:hypothetical protein
MQCNTWGPHITRATKALRILQEIDRHMHMHMHLHMHGYGFGDRRTPYAYDDQDSSEGAYGTWRVAWHGMAWRGVAWRGVAWRGVAWLHS